MLSTNYEILTVFAIKMTELGSQIATTCGLPN